MRPTRLAALAALALLTPYACGDDDAGGGEGVLDAGGGESVLDAGGSDPDARADGGVDAGSEPSSGSGGHDGGGTDAGPSPGADAGPPDAGSLDAGSLDAGADAGATTAAHAALQLSWTLVSAGGDPLACDDVPAALEVAIVLTPTSSSDAVQTAATCDIGVATLTEVAFGDYALSVQLLDGTSLALGEAPSRSVTLSSDACDAIVDEACVHELAVEIEVF